VLPLKNLTKFSAQLLKRLSKIKICQIILFTLTLSVSGFAHAQESTVHTAIPTLTSAKDSKTIYLGALEFPPFAYSGIGSSECIGYVMEVTRAILNENGYKLDAICAPAIRVYRMIQSGELDLTVNIKSTKLLQGHADFIEPNFGELELIFLSHKDRGFENMVSAIRGFDYHGERDKLVADGYSFQDTPGSIDAIKIFMRERTRHLITYKAPFKFYLEQNGFFMPSDAEVRELRALPTYYAISKKSDKYELLKKILTEHAQKKDIKRFDELLTFF
jgi:polar amino acid transport system substrate-binding protein